MTNTNNKQSGLNRMSDKQISVGMNRLNKRIEDLKKIQSDNLLYDDPKIDAFIDKIRNTILHIFGEDSIEFENYQYFSINTGDLAGQSKSFYQKYFREKGLPYAIEKLSGLYETMEEYLEDFEIMTRVERKLTLPDYSSLENESSTQKQKYGKSDSVFIVHGRNLDIAKSMFDFLKSLNVKAMGFSEAKKRTEKPAAYIGEVLENVFKKGQSVIVVSTPDDEVKLRPELHFPNEKTDEVEYRAQARPNVIFEAGMALAMSPDKTILVEIGDLKSFSDIQGRHVVKFNGSIESRKNLITHLEIAKIDFRIDDDKWKTIGNFEIKPLEQSKLSAEIQPKSTEISSIIKKYLTTYKYKRNQNAPTLDSQFQIFENLGQEIIDYLAENESQIKQPGKHLLEEVLNRIGRLERLSKMTDDSFFHTADEIVDILNRDVFK